MWIFPLVFNLSEFEEYEPVSCFVDKRVYVYLLLLPDDDVKNNLEKSSLLLLWFSVDIMSLPVNLRTINLLHEVFN